MTTNCQPHQELEGRAVPATHRVDAANTTELVCAEHAATAREFIERGDYPSGSSVTELNK